MTDKKAKKKAAKQGKGGAEPSVLGSLPSTRTPRIGRRREDPPATSRATANVSAASKPRPKAAKPRREAAKPRAVRSGSPSLERPAPEPAARRERPSGPPRGTALVTTTVQAAGELAQIGASFGARIVKRAVDRLPKP